MNFDALFYREYDYGRYNCLHFTIEAWQMLFGVDLSILAQVFVQEGREYRMGGLSRCRMFRRLRNPESPCLCHMRGVASDETHMATFLDGRVLHINELGVQYFPPEVIFPQFKKVLFYEYRRNH